MGRVIHRSQALLADVRVDLCGRQARVSEQLLDDAQIGAAIEKVRGVAVTQCVRMGGRDPRRSDPSIDQAPYITWSQGVAPPIGEQEVTLRRTTLRRATGRGTVRLGPSGLGGGADWEMFWPGRSEG